MYRPIAVPLPKGLAGAAAKTAVTKMIEHGWLQEVGAKLRRNEPLWRKTGDGHGTTLVVTDAGLLAIGIEPVVASAVASAQKAKPKSVVAQTLKVADTAKPILLRSGTKQAQIIAMLQRPKGATIAEIAVATSWHAHTARGMISGALKKLWLPINAQAVEGRGRVYRIG